jgi:hypothetical protein
MTARKSANGIQPVMEKHEAFLLNLIGLAYALVRPARPLGTIRESLSEQTEPDWETGGRENPAPGLLTVKSPSSGSSSVT